MLALQSLNLMTRISYLNGQFLEHDKCLIHIEDRGFQFADGVYEVILFNNGKLIDGQNHINRLFRSLKELNINHDLTQQNLTDMLLELFSCNNITDNGYCYFNVTRGQHQRVQHQPQITSYTINATVTKTDKPQTSDKPIKVMTHQDIRWLRCDIKSVGLCASAMLKQKALDQGFDDTIMIRDNIITEATYANLFIIDKNKNLITRPCDNFILQGITRNRIIKIAQENNITVIERDFDEAELKSCQEAFLTSSTLLVRPISQIDQTVINDYKVGLITQKLANKYLDFIDRY